MGAECTRHSCKIVPTRPCKKSGTSCNGTVSQPGGSSSETSDTKKGETGSRFTKHNKVHVTTADSKEEIIVAKRNLGLQSQIPQTKVSSPGKGCSSQLKNSQSALECGLEESFASLRRNSATPDLQNSVFEANERVRSFSSKPSSAGSQASSSHLRRPPTKESRSVSISETDNFVQLNQYRLMDEIGKVC